MIKVKKMLMNENLNEDLDLLIANLQADYLMNNPEIISRETQSKEYFEYMAFALENASEYLGIVSRAYKKIVESWQYENMPLQERINKITGIKS